MPEKQRKTKEKTGATGTRKDNTPHAARVVNEIKESRKHRPKGNLELYKHKHRRQRLTLQQEAFVDAILADPQRNGSNAARKAGYASAESVSSQLLRNPRVLDEIRRRTRVSAISGSETLGIIAELAKSDIADFISLHPKTGDPYWDWPKAVALGVTHLVKTVQFKDGAIHKIELHDKAPYVQMIAKNHGLLTERVVVEHTIDRTTARNDLAAKLDQLIRRNDLTTTSGNASLPGPTSRQGDENRDVTGFPVIDVTDESTQHDDTKGDKSS